MNDKQKRFCEEYIITLNGSDAAIKAGYSESTARQKAYELLSMDSVSEYIYELKKAKSEELNITFNDIALIEWGIATEGEKDSDRLKATDQLSRKLGFYKEDNKQKEVSINLISLGKGSNPE